MQIKTQDILPTQNNGKHVAQYQRSIQPYQRSENQQPAWGQQSNDRRHMAAGEPPFQQYAQTPQHQGAWGSRAVATLEPTYDPYYENQRTTATKMKEVQLFRRQVENRADQEQIADIVENSSMSTNRMKIKSDLDHGQGIYNEFITTQQEIQSQQQLPSPGQDIRIASDHDDFVAADEPKWRPPHRRNMLSAFVISNQDLEMPVPRARKAADGNEGWDDKMKTNDNSKATEATAAAGRQKPATYQIYMDEANRSQNMEGKRLEHSEGKEVRPFGSTPSAKSPLEQELRQATQRLNQMEKRLKQLALINRDVSYSNNLLKDTIQQIVDAVKANDGRQEELIASLPQKYRSIALDVMQETPEQRRLQDDRLQPKFAQELVANCRGPAYVRREHRPYGPSVSPKNNLPELPATEPRRHFVDRFGNKQTLGRDPQQEAEGDRADALQTEPTRSDSPKISVVHAQSAQARRNRLLRSSIQPGASSQDLHSDRGQLRQSHAFGERNADEQRPSPRFYNVEDQVTRPDAASEYGPLTERFQGYRSQMFPSSYNALQSAIGEPQAQGPAGPPRRLKSRPKQSRGVGEPPNGALPKASRLRGRPQPELDQPNIYSDGGLEQEDVEQIEYDRAAYRAQHKSAIRGGGPRSHAERSQERGSRTSKKRIKAVDILYRSTTYDGAPDGDSAQFGAGRSVERVWAVEEAPYPETNVKYVQVKTKQRDRGTERSQEPAMKVQEDEDGSSEPVAQETNRLQPLLMSQLFVCNSTAQRLSMCKFMIKKDLEGTNTPHGRSPTGRQGPGLQARNEPQNLYAGDPGRPGSVGGPPETTLATPYNDTDAERASLEQLSRKLTQSLKKQILKKASLISNIKPETAFENDVMQELSDDDVNFGAENNLTRGFSPANERFGPVKPHESKAVNSNVKYLSQIMKIDEYNIDDDDGDDQGRGINVPTTATSKRPSMTQRHSLARNSKEPLDFEKVFLIGHGGRNGHVDGAAEAAYLDALQMADKATPHEVKVPEILSSFQNPDPSKWQDRTKSQKELGKQIEEIIRHYAMPKGVKSQQMVGLSYQLQSLKNRMEEQLYALNAEQIERMKAYQGQSTGQQMTTQFGCVYDQKKLGAPYLVNMIKSIEDPSQERYVLITLTEDFSLEVVDGQSSGQQKFGLALSEVAIAVQFEDKNFQHMDFFLNQVKITYLEQRLAYAKSILNKVQNAARSLETVLSEVHREHEHSRRQASRNFREVNNQARAHCIKFLQSQALSVGTIDMQLPQFLGPTLFMCFDLNEILKIFSCLLLERQMLFVSDRRDLLSKVMFTFRDLLLQSTDFQWHYFFITCLPTVLIGNLHAPFPTMIGLLRDLFEYDALEEMLQQHKQAMGTPWETAGPCIVDIDQGKLFELEHYHAQAKLRHIMEATTETAAQRSRALEAQTRLAEIENRGPPTESVIVPSFLQRITHSRRFEGLKRREDGIGSIQDLALLGTEIDAALKEEVLRKSPLYQELTRLPASFKHSAGREQMLSKGVLNDIGQSPSRLRALEHAKMAGLPPDEQEAMKNSSNVEIIQKQILRYYDQIQFQKILNQKNQQLRRTTASTPRGTNLEPKTPIRKQETLAVPEGELEADKNYQKAYRDYQFVSQFIITQMFVTLLESKAESGS